MSVSLQKGQKVSLSKDNAGLSKVIVGLGWDEAPQGKRGFFAPKPQPIDCDASALMLRSGKLCANEDIIYFGNLKHPTGTVQHMGDNLTGEGEGDDEQIEDLADNLDDITRGIEQMSIAKDETLSAIQSISDVSDRAAASTSQVSSTIVNQMDAVKNLNDDAETLNNNSRDLMDAVTQFKLN